MSAAYVTHRAGLADHAIGVDLWHGLDRQSWILPAGLYIVRDGDTDVGMFWVGVAGEWFFQSRCGRVIGGPAWWLDRRPENAGPVIRRSAAWWSQTK